MDGKILRSRDRIVSEDIAVIYQLITLQSCAYIFEKNYTRCHRYYWVST